MGRKRRHQSQQNAVKKCKASSSVAANESCDEYVSNPKANELFHWADELNRAKNNVDCVPVGCFVGGLLAKECTHIPTGLLVEVPHHVDEADTEGKERVQLHWVAEIIGFRGFFMRLRYIGGNKMNDFYVSLLSQDVKFIGYCAANKQVLAPPTSIKSNQRNWKGFVVQQLEGRRTLPQKWAQHVKQSIANHSLLKKGMICEMIDTYKPSQVVPGQVMKVTGDRLLMEPAVEFKSTVAEEEDDDDRPDEYKVFVLSSRSPLLFPVGWAKRVGYKLHANQAYEQLCETIIREDPAGDGCNRNPYCAPDGTQKYSSLKEHNWFLVPPEEMCSTNNNNETWQEGMKFECLDPFMQTEMNVATVAKVLNDDWLQVVFEGYFIGESDNDDNSTFPLHKRSPYIFPAGFCASPDLNIKLNPTANDDPDGESFDWTTFLEKNPNVVLAPDQLFPSVEVKHDPMTSFKVGSHLEAPDPIFWRPQIMFPASVVKVAAGRLIKITFDGWPDFYDHWFDYRAPEIKPIGWCEAVGHVMEPPPT